MVETSDSVGVILVIILIFLKGDLTIKMLTDATWSTIRTVGSLYLIVVGASMFNFLITVTQMPFTVVDFIDSLALTPLGIILVICAIYIVLGTLMDSLAMLFLTIPVFYPVTPPVGMNLFVIKGVMQSTPLKTIWFGTVPFLFADMIRVALIIIFPAICLYLPSLMN